MNILGFSGIANGDFYRQNYGLRFVGHDSSVALVVDGKVAFAVEEERISREKHTSRFPVHAFAAALALAGLEVKDVDRVAHTWYVSPPRMAHMFAHHAVPAMIERGRGVVVNFSSWWGREGAAEVAPYCTTKWAIEGLTRAMAAELPRGMAAVPVVPGIIDTAMLRSCFGADAANYPEPAAWAEKAVPFLLKLGPKGNGKPREVPE